MRGRMATIRTYRKADTQSIFILDVRFVIIVIKTPLCEIHGPIRRVNALLLKSVDENCLLSNTRTKAHFLRGNHNEEQRQIPEGMEARTHLELGKDVQKRLDVPDRDVFKVNGCDATQGDVIALHCLGRRRKFWKLVPVSEVVRFAECGRLVKFEPCALGQNKPRVLGNVIGKHGLVVWAPREMFLGHVL